MKKIIINNPDQVDLSRIHLEWDIMTAIDTYRNHKSEFPVEVSDDVEIISYKETKMEYNHCQLITKIKNNIMTVNVSKL